MYNKQTFHLKTELHSVWRSFLLLSGRHDAERNSFLWSV